MNETATVFFAKQMARASTDPDYHADRLQIEIAESVYVAMQAGGVTQATLARRMGVSRQHVSRLLEGTQNVTLATLGKLAVALGGNWTLALVTRGAPGPHPTMYAVCTPCVAEQHERCEAECDCSHEGKEG